MTDRELLGEMFDKIGRQIGKDPDMGSDYRIRPNLSFKKNMRGNFCGWLWPAPIWNENVPVVSDGFNRVEKGEAGSPGHKRQHLGVDIMYRNLSARTERLPEVTKWHHMPSNVPYICPGPGHIWFAGKTGTGWTVKIDHHDWVGFPLMTYHTHMSQLLIDEWDENEDGLYVPAGCPIGIIGNSPASKNDPNHIHFELWDYSIETSNGRVDRAMDPNSFLPAFSWRVLYG